MSAISRGWIRGCHCFISYLTILIMRKFFVLLGELASGVGKGTRLLMEDEQGQAVIEYVLMVSVMVTAVGSLAYGLRKTLFKLWGKLAQEITAACPSCPPDPAIRLR